MVEFQAIYNVRSRTLILYMHWKWVLSQCRNNKHFGTLWWIDTSGQGALKCNSTFWTTCAVLRLTRVAFYTSYGVPEAKGVSWVSLQGTASIAFVIACFHFHRLVERSLLGSSMWSALVYVQFVPVWVVSGLWLGWAGVISMFIYIQAKTWLFNRLFDRYYWSKIWNIAQYFQPVCLLMQRTGTAPSSPYSGPVIKAPFDDIDPEYGLHGYTLHITLHNTVAEIMSGHFSQLFCRKGGSLLYTVYILHLFIQILFIQSLFRIINLLLKPHPGSFKTTPWS